MNQPGSVRPNAKQVEEWNSATGRRWLERHERIDRQIAPFEPAPQDNLFITIPMGAAARHISLPAPGEPDAPGPFAFADLDRVRRILSRSGFGEIETDWLTEKVGGGTLDETTDMLLELGPLGDKLNSLDGSTQNAIMA